MLPSEAATLFFATFRDYYPPADYKWRADVLTVVPGDGGKLVLTVWSGKSLIMRLDIETGTLEAAQEAARRASVLCPALA